MSKITISHMSQVFLRAVVFFFSAFSHVNKGINVTCDLEAFTSDGFFSHAIKINLQFWLLSGVNENVYT